MIHRKRDGLTHPSRSFASFTLPPSLTYEASLSCNFAKLLEWNMSRKVREQFISTSEQFFAHAAPVLIYPFWDITSPHVCRHVSSKLRSALCFENAQLTMLHCIAL